MHNIATIQVYNTYTYYFPDKPMNIIDMMDNCQ